MRLFVYLQPEKPRLLAHSVNSYVPVGVTTASNVISSSRRSADSSSGGDMLRTADSGPAYVMLTPEAEANDNAAAYERQLSSPCSSAYNDDVFVDDDANADDDVADNVSGDYAQLTTSPESLTTVGKKYYVITKHVLKLQVYATPYFAKLLRIV